MWENPLIIVIGIAVLAAILKLAGIDGVSGLAKAAKEAFASPDGPEREGRPSSQADAGSKPEGEAGGRRRPSRDNDPIDDWFRTGSGEKPSNGKSEPAAGDTGPTGWGNDGDMGEIPVSTGPPSGQVVVTGVPVPREWAIHCSLVAEADLSDDGALIAFFKREAAGFHAYSRAIEIIVEHLSVARQLDKRVVQKVLGVAETIPEVVDAFTAVLEEFRVVYGGIEEDIAERNVGLPLDARNWMTGAQG